MGGMDHGSDFDVMWLQSMIEHHDGAVTMAQIEIDDGANEEAIDLARLIVETQNGSGADESGGTRRPVRV